MNQYYLTEWLSDTKSDDLIIHIYTMPLIDGTCRHSAGGAIAYELSKGNGYQTVIFYEQYIASFEEIKNWGNETFINYEMRPINKKKATEKMILERLIKKELENKTRTDYIIDKGAFRLKKSKLIRTNELSIFPAIFLSITVDENGGICVGFEYKHRFEYKETIDKLLIKDPKAIKQGTKLVDPTNQKTHEYIYKEIAPYNAGDVSPYLSESVIDYYKRNNKDYKLKGINSESMIVHVETKQGQVFPYLPNLLKISCSLEQLPNHLKNIAIKAIKLSPHDKMSELLRETTEILRKIDRLKFSKKNVLVDNLGYQIKYVDAPSLMFGKDQKTKNINAGLLNGGVYSGKEAKVSFFVDPILLSNDLSRTKVGQFSKLLEIESSKLGVKLDISYKPQDLRGQLDYQLFTAPDLSLQLKSLGEYFEGTVIVIASPESIENAYRVVKKEFGGRQDIVTQFVEFGENLLNISKSRYTILNVLLGIYVKSGLQPWILGEELSSDCFIGLDVSHEDGKHSAGIIQIIGKDGRLIKQKSVATNEAGEIISWETLEDIVYDSLHSYKEVYGEKPKHITFHRDGFCRENLEKLDDTLSKMEILFDYVEVVKNANRRMAVYENNKWTTKQSLSYLKERSGYLCSTSPKESIGMAKPIKINQKTSILDFEDIMSDVYKLSFMHIHSMLKTRLPISTHYADLSSTFHNRGLVHPRSKHEHALPFV